MKTGLTRNIIRLLFSCPDRPLENAYMSPAGQGPTRSKNHSSVASRWNERFSFAGPAHRLSRVRALGQARARADLYHGCTKILDVFRSKSGIILSKF